MSVATWSHSIESFPQSLPLNTYNMPTSSGPTTVLSAEDDWTRVKDPKEKKRIQNRVAQRTYRHRMKARLGELQARLDQHERKQKQQKRTSSQDITEQCIAPSAISTFSAHSSGEESSPSPVSADKPSTPQSIPMMHQPAIYDPCPDDLDGANMFAAHTAAGAHLLNSPPNSNHSPQPNDLLSPPVRPVTDASGKPVSQDFMLDCLRFQTSLFPAEQHPQHPQHPQHHHHHHHQQQQYPTYPEAGVAPGAISQPGEVPCVDGFPGHSESMEFAFEPAAPVDVWKQDPMMPKMQETPPASDVVNFPAMAGPGPQGPSPPAAMDSALDPNMDPAMMNAARTSQPPPPPPSGPSGPQRTHVANDERFTSILEHVQAAGFESFDALVTAYYSDNFDESSALANEQRLSRNRRLPKVLSDLFHAADGWTPWERRGFHEEILKTAESMLISEGGVAKHTLLTKLSPLLDNQEACTPEIVNAMKRSVQNDMPNSWALSMALAADNRQAWQRDCSNTALATTLLLSYAGKMPNEQLLQLIGSCL